MTELHSKARSKATVAICLLAANATLFLILPGEYCRLTTTAESLFVVVIVGPYLLLALLAWSFRSDQRASQSLLILNVLVALGGLGVFAAETSSYRKQVANFIAHDPGRGAEYIQARIQRMAIFLAPALQWSVILLAAGALLVQTMGKKGDAHGTVE